MQQRTLRGRPGGTRTRSRRAPTDRMGRPRSAGALEPKAEDSRAAQELFVGSFPLAWYCSSMQQKTSRGDHAGCPAARAFRRPTPTSSSSCKCGDGPHLGRHRGCEQRRTRLSLRSTTTPSANSMPSFAPAAIPSALFGPYRAGTVEYHPSRLPNFSTAPSAGVFADPPRPFLTLMRRTSNRMPDNLVTLTRNQMGTGCSVDPIPASTRLAALSVRGSRRPDGGDQVLERMGFCRKPTRSGR